MRTDYGILLAGGYLPIEQVGNCHSPVLRNIFKNEELYFAFCLVRSVSGGSEDVVRKLVVEMNLRTAFGAMTDMDFDRLAKFDLVWEAAPLRSLFGIGLSLFFDEPIALLPDNRCFALVGENDAIVGVINRDNFSKVCSMLSTVASPPKDEDESELKFGSEAAKELWEKHNKLEAEHPPAHSDDYSLANIISRLSCGTTAYTLFTIYDLSVFQLYDQFDAYTQNRVSSIGEKAYSTWGGDDFDPMSWFYRNKTDNGG